MQTRVVLAVLILTNPICCQMFGSTVPVRTDEAEEPVAQCNGCACECEPCKPSNEGESVPHAPCECPNCDLCQCICAGAVVEDVVTFDDTDGAAPFVVNFECGTATGSLLSPRSRSWDAEMPCCGAVVGRAARIQYCSLLC